MTLLHPIPLLSMLTLLVACGDDAPLGGDASDASTGTCTQPHDLECLDGPVSSTSSSTSSPDTGSGSGTDTDGTSTGPECTDDDACTDPEAAFCGPQGQCVACDGTPDPHQACALRDPATPVCDRGTCVQCTPDQPLACDGATPVCGPDHACIACTEHDQCPDSACHLDGDLRGACFDPADVVMVADAMQLDAALADLAADDRAVFVLSPGTYGTTVTLGGSSEVAILGTTTPILAGDGPRAIDVFADAFLYLDGVQVVNGSGDGLSCSGTAVWLDDTEVRNNADLGIDVSGGCAAHLRRSIVSANGAGGLSANGGSSSIMLEVSAVVGNNNTNAIPAISLQNSADLYASFSTITDNFAGIGMTDSITCNGSDGLIHNSIILGAEVESVIGCDGLTLLGNAVDTDAFGGTNVNVGAHDDALFESPVMANYRLSPAGQTTFMDIALWQPGDPTADIDGDPIPADLPSFPGYDQP